jgi:hypothetical protein
LQRGEDSQFDQLLSSFGSVAEHCLPSLLKTLFAWFERQGIEMPGNEHKAKGDTKRRYVHCYTFISQYSSHIYSIVAMRLKYLSALKKNISWKEEI